jgi:hypothetical protein
MEHPDRQARGVRKESPADCREPANLEALTPRTFEFTLEGSWRDCLRWGVSPVVMDSIVTAAAHTGPVAIIIDLSGGGAEPIAVRRTACLTLYP